MNRTLKNRLKTSLRVPTAHVDENHLQKVIAQAHNECSKKEIRNRINFLTFLVNQLKYTAWKIWMVQGMILLVLCLVLSVIFGELLLSRPKHTAVLLSGSAILVLMTAIPFIQRGFQYKMHETEAATKYSSVKLLFAKLLIIGIGDALMLGSVLLLALFKSTLNMPAIVFYLMLPFLMLTSVFLYVLGHVPAHFFSICCSSIGVVVFLVISGLCYLYPEVTKQTFSVYWGLICIVLTIFCIYQFRYIMQCSSYAEIQFS